MLKLEDGSMAMDTDCIKKEVLEYFQHLYSSRANQTSINGEVINSVIHSLLIEDQQTTLIKSITAIDVKEAHFSLGHNKASRPDDCPVEFFVQCWHVVGDLLTEEMLDFFQHGRLLKEVCIIVIALVPKIINPTSLSDYKPIPYSNVTYKCITKIMANRLKLVRPMLVGRELTAFISSRCIANKILLTHELVHGY